METTTFGGLFKFAVLIIITLVVFGYSLWRIYNWTGWAQERKVISIYPFCAIYFPLLFIFPDESSTWAAIILYAVTTTYMSIVLFINAIWATIKDTYDLYGVLLYMVSSMFLTMAIWVGIVSEFKIL
ncbi:MAG: hypothetical protein II371_03555 [Flavobacteriales bacterium]|nr:hypothetical protein [Flavobacteriales bacterium]